MVLVVTFKFIGVDFKVECIVLADIHTSSQNDVLFLLGYERETTIALLNKFTACPYIPLVHGLIQVREPSLPPILPQGNIIPGTACWQHICS